MKKNILKKLFLFMGALTYLSPIFAVSGWDQAKPSDFIDDFSFGFSELLVVVFVLIAFLSVIVGLIRKIFQKK